MCGGWTVGLGPSRHAEFRNRESTRDASAPIGSWVSASLTQFGVAVVSLCRERCQARLRPSRCPA